MRVEHERPGSEPRGGADPASQPSDRLGEPLKCNTGGQFPEPQSVAEALARLAAILPGLQRAIERPAAPPVPRLALRRSEIANALGVKIRILQREQAAGRFPKPDLHVGRVPLWTPETIRQWIEEGGRQ